MGRRHGVSFEAPGGSVAVMVTGAAEKTILLDTILGLRRPNRGKVLVLDTDVYSVPEKRRLEIYRRVGTVLESGGLISNLKVWENIALPVWYHAGRRPRELEGEVVRLAEQMGMSPSYLADLMKRLPGPLPAHEKRKVGLIRTLLTAPDLIIYDSIFDGLDAETTGRLARLTQDFQGDKAGRTSLYVTNNPLSVAGISADHTMRLSELGLWN